MIRFDGAVWRCILAFFLLGALAVSGTAAAAGGKKLDVLRHEHVADELLVKLRPNVAEKEARALWQEHGGNGHEAKRFKAPRKASHAAVGRWWHIKLPRGRDAKQVMERLAKHPKVEAVEPNYAVRAVATPNDPRYSELWGLNNVGQTGGANDADVDAPEAWDRVTGSSSVVVAVIDSGVDYTHPDLVNNIWTNPGEIPGNGIDDDGNGYVDDVYGYDFYNFDANPMDDHGHGTHCAGTIAASGNNGIGVVGVSWNARIMAVKFLGASGGGTTSGAISAVLYATNMGARILSNSWGGGGYSQALYDAIVAARDAGALFVAAAGNSNSNNDSVPHYPSSYEVENVLAVAATDHNDLRASFSSYGANSVDLGAPGVNILSSVPATGNSCCSDPSGYRLLSGTSMATPHVSGAAALLLAQDGSRSAVGLKNLLMATVDPVSSLAGLTVTGGRLNVSNAVSCSPTQLALQLTQPGTSFSAFVNEPQPVRALAHACGSPVTGAQVNASASSGETIVLYDDGAHGDGAVNDGMYGNTWTPASLGGVTLVVTATHGTLGSDTKSVTGEVRERVRYAMTAAPFAWNDITSGSRYSLGDDSAVTIPLGFNFVFHGVSYSSVTIGSNGLLGFDPAGATSYTNAAIPNAATPNNLIAAFWDDLNPGAGGSVYSKAEGVAPNRQLTVAWVNVPHYSFAGAVSFQVILREGSEDVLLQYQDVVFGDAVVDNGASATVGVENATGTDGLQYSFDEARLANLSALRFYRNTGGNNAPVANPGGPYQANLNVGLTLNGSASYDPDGSSLSYRWDFGDGTTGTGVRPVHAYSSKGTYPVTLVVNDGQLDSASVSTTATVSNTPPVARTNGPYTGQIGTVITFNASTSSDADGDPLTYQWNFGDGASATGVQVTHAYSAKGSFPVTLIVNDGMADSTATTTATISNRGPTANPGGPYSGYVGSPVSFDGSASFDPDGDPLTYQWSFGDGTTGSGARPTHTYSAKGTYTVTLSVHDGAVYSPAVTTTVTIANRAPSANAGGPYSGYKGSAVVFNGSGSSDPDGDVLTYRWNFGDGTTGAGAQPSHVYNAKGTYTVTLTVNDGTVDSAPATTTVTIANRAPIANPGGPYTGYADSPVSFTGAGSSDPDGDALTYRWDFGDGTTGTGAQPTHAYDTKGSYTVRLVVNDGALDSGAASTTVTIWNSAPIAVGGGPYSGYLNTSISFSSVGSHDADGDTLTYQWSFGDLGTSWQANPTHAYMSPGTYEVRLVVNDGTVNSVSWVTTAQIVNQPPVANAGPDQTVRKNVGTVRLDGSASYDPDRLQWRRISWQQVSGTPVTWSNIDTLQPTISIPKSIKPGELIFELMVTDFHGASASDRVSVFVTN